MRIWTGVASIAGAVAAGGLVYGWGIGLFYPCGPLDRLMRVSDCHILTTFEAAQPQTLLLLPNGNLLTVLRGDGPEPDQPQQLTELAASDGSVVSQVPIDGLPAGGSWMSAALSPSGDLLAAGLLNQPAAVLDRATGKKLSEMPLYSVALLGFDGDDRVLLDRGEVSSEHPPDISAEVYSAKDGTAQGTLTDGNAIPIYSQGVSQAFSPDGKLLAQHVETEGDSGIVAIRLADAAFQSWSGTLLTAPLGSWSKQMLPMLWFSPDGKFLAAAFDDPNVWGKETSALLIWDIEARALVQRVPTRNADWDSLAWLPDQRAVAVTRFDIDSRRGEIAVVRY